LIALQSAKDYFNAERRTRLRTFSSNALSRLL